MAIWTSETTAQQPIRPIYDPFFEMFTSTVEAGQRELTPNRKGLTFKDTRYLLPSYRLNIFVNIYPASAYFDPGVSTELITIVAVIDDGANQQTFFILVNGIGTGKNWLERRWEYGFKKLPSDPVGKEVSEDFAKEAAKKFLDLWHGRSSIAPKDIPKIFH